MGWVLLASPTPRGRAYLQFVHRAGLRPQMVILQGSEAEDRSIASSSHLPGFDPGESLRQTLARAGWPYQEGVSLDPNHGEVVEAVRKCGAELAVFSGGGILRPSTLDAAGRWLHVHPGRLPDWRGSTCHYYGLLLEGAIEATAFFLEAGLDAGAIVCRRRFRPTAQWRAEDLDQNLDAWVRATVLVEALQLLLAQPHFSGQNQDSEEGQMFYVIHPVLKHLAARSLECCRSAASPLPEVRSCPSC